MTAPARAAADRIVEHADATGFRAHGLHVRVGDDVVEHRWAPDVREDIHSVAKGVCVLAAGIAEAEGAVSLDDRLSMLAAPEHGLGAGVGEVTLRDLLTMSSGIDLPWSETMMTDWPDLATEFLRRPTTGRAFQYSNASTYTAMALLSARVGDIVEYLTPRLFAPLGIGAVEWDRCPNGRIVAGAGLRLRTEEMSRIGRLIRDRGTWEGRRLVPPPIVDVMHSDWVVAGASPGYDRYAMAGWAGPGSAWRLHGAYGQLIVFHGDAVVTISADDHAGADAMASFVVDVLGG